MGKESDKVLAIGTIQKAVGRFKRQVSLQDWQFVVIYPSRTTEQRDIYPYRSFLGDGRVHRIYLVDMVVTIIS